MNVYIQLNLRYTLCSQDFVSSLLIMHLPLNCQLPLRVDTFYCLEILLASLNSFRWSKLSSLMLWASKSSWKTNLRCKWISLANAVMWPQASWGGFSRYTSWWRFGRSTSCSGGFEGLTSCWSDDIYVICLVCRTSIYWQVLHWSFWWLFQQTSHCMPILVVWHDFFTLNICTLHFEA